MNYIYVCIQLSPLDICLSLHVCHALYRLRECKCGKRRLLLMCAGNMFGLVWSQKVICQSLPIMLKVMMDLIFVTQSKFPTSFVLCLAQNLCNIFLLTSNVYVWVSLCNHIDIHSQILMYQYCWNNLQHGKTHVKLPYFLSYAGSV
jgi:hypothetical protein